MGESKSNQLLSAHEPRRDRWLQFIAILFVSIGLLVLGGFAIVAWYTFGTRVSFDAPTTGQIGDFVGGVVGTLFAFSGTILLYLTLTIQRREHLRAMGEMHTDRAFSTCLRFIDDVRGRIWLFEFGSSKGGEALAKLTQSWQNTAQLMLNDLAISGQSETFSDATVYSMKALAGIFAKLGAVLSLLERPGIDNVIRLALAVDVQDTLDQLEPSRIHVFGAHSSLNASTTILRNRTLDERMEHLNTTSAWMELGFSDREHQSLQERLFALRKQALSLE